MITYHIGIVPKQDDPAFYKWDNGQTLIATVTGTKKLNVVANGEMYLSIPYVVDGDLSEHQTNVIKYSDQLEDAGIKTDAQLNQFTKTMSDTGWEVWHQNNWFEVYAEDDEDGVVFHSLKEALEFAEGEVK
jgi:hypothetical protein